MRGSIRQRSKGSWLITLEFGYRKDPVTGQTKRVQKFITFHGTKRKAQDKQPSKKASCAITLTTGETVPTPTE